MASSSERPAHIPLPPAAGLRSALKHHSQTPSGGASASSSSVFSLSSPPHSPSLVGAPLAAVSTTASSATNLGTPLANSSTGYTPKVSFDTFENPDAPMFSFTLRASSELYTRNRATRVFLCAASADESGTEALDWVMESLVQDGDELIVFRGFDTEVLGTRHYFFFHSSTDNRS